MPEITIGNQTIRVESIDLQSTQSTDFATFRKFADRMRREVELTLNLPAHMVQDERCSFCPMGKSEEELAFHRLSRAWGQT